MSEFDDVEMRSRAQRVAESRVGWPPPANGWHFDGKPVWYVGHVRTGGFFRIYRDWSVLRAWITEYVEVGVVVGLAGNELVGADYRVSNDVHGTLAPSRGTHPSSHPDIEFTLASLDQLLMLDRIYEGSYKQVEPIGKYKPGESASYAEQYREELTTESRYWAEVAGEGVLTSLASMLAAQRPTPVVRTIGAPAVTALSPGNRGSAPSLAERRVLMEQVRRRAKRAGIFWGLLIWIPVATLSYVPVALLMMLFYAGGNSDELVGRILATLLFLAVPTCAIAVSVSVKHAIKKHIDQQG